MTLNLSPQVEEALNNFAIREGVDPATIIEKMVRAYQPNADVPDVPDVFTAENDPLLARLEARVASAPTDPKDVREAEDDLNDFMRALNATRRDAGARMLYPDVQ